MISQVLLRLIDETIVPAILLITTKILGMWFVTILFRIDWQFSLSATASGIEFSSHEGLLMVNSYSNLLVVIVLTFNILWLLVKAYHFHETHISPSFTLKLLSLNLTRLISTSVEVYHKALIWLSYLWLVVFLSILHSAMGVSYGWVVAVSFGVALFMTWLFINDLERELTI
ncbi:hypothetical protein KC571_00185 [candidate division WWE3 bacterium]|uniref:Uncharacterized protein n=1 Tax=candidate division WWE3 bacterium TaxID=2053526 RepID=A0A955LWL9_UNCKA|nr:hypothetical protein [candidate division WWE3 bacterium]MCA9398012.1 hypothetical protein [candidate division WWE3 bacterium]